MTCLTKNERIQVHHNYILAVSSLEHKKDLINRLKRSDTHNIPAYEAEMSRHMTLHEDVLERILNILKQDDYYRTLEDLPVIDELTAYDDIRLFPELYDTSTIIERVTAEADLIDDNSDNRVCIPSIQIYHILHLTHLKPHLTFNPHQQTIAQSLHLRVHYPVGREHLQHRLVLQMHHPHKHHPRHLQTHHINQKSLHTHSTPHQAHTDSI